LAPATTAPVVSVTSPVKAPRSLWAKAHATNDRKANKAFRVIFKTLSKLMETTSSCGRAQVNPVGTERKAKAQGIDLRHFWARLKKQPSIHSVTPVQDRETKPSAWVAVWQSIISFQA